MPFSELVEEVKSIQSQEQRFQKLSQFLAYEVNRRDLNLADIETIIALLHPEDSGIEGEESNPWTSAIVLFLKYGDLISKMYIDTADSIIQADFEATKIICQNQKINQEALTRLLKLASDELIFKLLKVDNICRHFTIKEIVAIFQREHPGDSHKYMNTVYRKLYSLMVQSAYLKQTLERLLSSPFGCYQFSLLKIFFSHDQWHQDELTQLFNNNKTLTQLFFDGYFSFAASRQYPTRAQGSAYLNWAYQNMSADIVTVTFFQYCARYDLDWLSQCLEKKDYFNRLSIIEWRNLIDWTKTYPYKGDNQNALLNESKSVTDIIINAIDKHLGWQDAPQPASLVPFLPYCSLKQFKLLIPQLEPTAINFNHLKDILKDFDKRHYLINETDILDSFSLMDFKELFLDKLLEESDLEVLFRRKIVAQDMKPHDLNSYIRFSLFLPRIDVSIRSQSDDSQRKIFFDAIFKIKEVRARYTYWDLKQLQTPATCYRGEQLASLLSQHVDLYDRFIIGEIRDNKWDKKGRGFWQYHTPSYIQAMRDIINNAEDSLTEEQRISIKGLAQSAGQSSHWWMINFRDDETQQFYNNVGGL